MTAPRCPITGYAVSTAYTREKCRCDDCVAWSRAEYAKRPKRVKSAPLTVAEQDALFIQFVADLRADVGLVVELAEVARESVENDHH